MGEEIFSQRGAERRSAATDERKELDLYSFDTDAFGLTASVKFRAASRAEVPSAAGPLMSLMQAAPCVR